MVEEQNTPITVENFKEVFSNPASDDSLANAMAATNLFSDGNLSQKDIIDLVKSNQDANTSSLLSKQRAEEAKNKVFASVITHIANSQNSNFIFNEDSFTESVQKPMSNWSVNQEATEKEEIMELRKKTESTITGVLWTLYSDELKVRGYSDNFQLAKEIFPDRDYVIRPDTFGPSVIEDSKREIINSK